MKNLLQYNIKKNTLGYFSGVLCFVVLYLGNFSAWAMESLVVEDSTKEIALTNYIEILTDKTNQLRIEDISKPDVDGKFVSYHRISDKYNANLNTYWIRFSIKNHKNYPAHYLLKIDNIDFADFYIPDGKGDFIEKKGGTLYGLHQREVFLGRVPHIAFSLAANEEYVCYLRVELQTQFNIQNKKYFDTIRHISIKNRDYAFTVYNQTRYYQGFYIGAVIIIAFYNLFLFLFMRDKSYLFYVLFVLASGASNTVLEGYALEFLWSEDPLVDLLVAYELLAISWFFFLKFTSSFLNVERISQQFNKYLEYTAYAHVGFMALTLFNYWNLYISIFLSSFTILLVLGLNVWFVRRGYRPAIYFLLANVFFLVGQFLLILAILEIIPQTPLTWHTEEIGEILQALMFSVALADRITLLQKEVSRKRVEQAQQLQRQEEEKQKIIEEQKKALELEVERRTAEISKINKELKEQKEQLSIQHNYIEAKNNELEKKAYELLISKEELNKAYSDIILMSEIGRDITSSLELKEIVRTVFDHINRMMDASIFAVGIYDEKTQKIVFQHYYVNGEVQSTIVVNMAEKERIAVWCIKHRKAVVIGDYDEEYSKYVTNKRAALLSQDRKSVIYLPLDTKHRVTGVMTVQSGQKNAYKTREVKILETLASYVAIALDNFKTYDEINEAHQEIEHKNLLLTDSLRYARDIQEVILPNHEKLLNLSKDYFVIYKPKDFVSGDFYWVFEYQDKKYFALADCTGHGVPGAFMSMIGTTLLNQVVNDLEFTDDLGLILANLHSEFQKVLKQEDDNGQNNDGMDISLCMLTFPKENEATLRYSGAKRPLWYFSGNQLMEIKGTRQSIGGRIKKKEEYQKDFENHEVLLKKGDVIYLFSDGFVDQPNMLRKKLGTQAFREIIGRSAYLPLIQQKEIFMRFFHEHQNGEAQIDDVSLLALRI